MKPMSDELALSISAGGCTITAQCAVITLGGAIAGGWRGSKIGAALGMPWAGLAIGAIAVGGVAFAQACCS